MYTVSFVLACFGITFQTDTPLKKIINIYQIITHQSKVHPAENKENIAVPTLQMKFLPLRHQDLQGFQVHQRFQELRWQAFLQTGHAGPTRHAGDQVNEAKELMVGPSIMVTSPATMSHIDPG